MRRLLFAVLAVLCVLPLLCSVCAAEDTSVRAAEGITEERLLQLSGQYAAPCVYITTQGGQPVLSRDEYVPAVIDVFNGGEDHRLTAPGGVKVRGNSTATFSEEKPYRIKFDKKQNMLGLHGGEKYKSWVLLRSQWNLCMDYTAFNLARTIFDVRYYASDCTYVNLFINDAWMGIYLLCEQNQAARGRMEVYEPDEGLTKTDIR